MEHSLDNKKILILAGGIIAFMFVIVGSIFLLSQQTQNTNQDSETNQSVPSSIPTQAPKVSDSQQNTYRAENFSITYPTNWTSQLVSNSNTQGIQLFHPKNNPEGYPYMLVSVENQQLSESTQTGELVEIGGILFTKTRIPDSFIIRGGEVQAETAQEIVYSSNENQQSIKIIYIYQGEIDQGLEREFEKVIDSIIFYQ